MGISKKYTRQELIDELLRFEEENGRIPNSRDINLKNGYPSRRAYINEFGMFSNALKETPFKGEIEYRHQVRDIDKSKEFLISEILRYYNTYSIVPQVYDMRSGNGYPSINDYYETFGSWENALIEAGLLQKIDDNFFALECMNLRKWYILGYIVGDGNITKNYLSIGSIDKENLYDMYNYINPRSNVYIAKKEGYKPQYKFIIGNEQIVHDLEYYYDIASNKSKVVGFPLLFLDTYEKAGAFCRGVFDADGAITYHKNKNGTYSPSFFFCGSEGSCDDFSYLLEKYCNIKANVYKHSTIFCLRINNMKSVKKIYDFLYGHENFCIKRKKVRFEKLINGTFSLETDKY